MGLQERPINCDIWIENQEIEIVLAQILLEGIVIAMEKNTRGMHVSKTSDSYKFKSLVEQNKDSSQPQLMIICPLHYLGEKDLHAHQS